jgi:hypothetical protein
MRDRLTTPKLIAFGFFFVWVRYPSRRLSDRDRNSSPMAGLGDA